MTTMRTSLTFSVLFWIYAKRARNNQTNIYVRITLNGKKVNISLKQKVDVDIWDAKGQKVNGNITKLLRKGHTNESATTFGNMDNLTYGYDSGNKLLSVTDAVTTPTLMKGEFKDGNKTGNDYNYDDNGNLTSDANKGIMDIEYNHLNMPTKITVTGTNAGVLDYVYSADGIKLQKKKTQSGSTITTDYIGDYVYENNVLKQITQPEGYIEPDGSGWQYVYRLTDIWGNTRITFADDNNDGSVTSSEIRREQNYYPGGLEHRGYNASMSGVKNNLKTYQGQEFTEDLGLNTHEWRYRISDPATLRFWQVDPLAEDYYYNSTYAFAENKLGMGIELEGAEIYTWLQQKAVEDAVRHPNGVGAHTMGVSQGLANTATDVVDAVSNPVQTLKGAGNAALWFAVGSQFSEQVDGILGTNSIGAGDAILNSVVQGGDNLINGNGIERGTTIGEIGGAALGTKGTTSALKGISLTSRVSKGRVFWSGGKNAMNAAENFAKTNGMTTLEMTGAGKNLTNLTKDIPWSEAAPLWKNLSADFAKGAKGKIHVFQNAKTGVRIDVIWSKIEYPILKNNNIKIEYHNIFKD